MTNRAPTFFVWEIGDHSHHLLPTWTIAWTLGQNLILQPVWNCYQYMMGTVSIQKNQNVITIQKSKINYDQCTFKSMSISTMGNMMSTLSVARCLETILIIDLRWYDCRVDPPAYNKINISFIKCISMKKKTNLN